MNRHRTTLLLMAAALAVPLSAFALSIELPTPDIHFAQGYNAQRAQAVGVALSAKDLRYLGGIYSHWPPDWFTTLVYDGDARALNGLFDALTRIPGFGVRVTFSRDLSKETGSALPTGSWFVVYSQATPDVLTVRINLASKALDPTQLELQLGPAGSRVPHRGTQGARLPAPPEPIPNLRVRAARRSS